MNSQTILNNITTNRKGATAFKSTFNDTLDLYTWQSKTLPSSLDDFSNLVDTIENAFVNNPDLTIKLLKYKRLIDKGEGLRMLPFLMMLLVKIQDMQTYRLMLEWFRESDKDLLRLAKMSRLYFNKSNMNIELELYVDNLYNVFVDILNGNTNNNLLPIKYLPSNGNHFENERRVIRDLLNKKLLLNKSCLNLNETMFKTESQKFLCELLNNTFTQSNIFVNNRVLRNIKSYFDAKQYLAMPLQKSLHLNRQPFGYLEDDKEKEYDMIASYLSKLSTQAFNNVKKTKNKNEYLNGGLNKYFEMIKSNPTKVKTKGLTLTDELFNSFRTGTMDPVLEAQVMKQANDLKEYLNLADNNFVNDLFVIIDESGSMHGTPLNTALYHTLLLWIAFDLKSVLFFSTDSTYVQLPSDLNLLDKIKCLYRNTFGSTNLGSAFQYMVDNNIKNKHVLIFTDGDCDYSFSSSLHNNPFNLYLDKIQSNVCIFNLNRDKLCFPYLAQDPRTCYLGGNNIKVLNGLTKALAKSILNKQPITPSDILLESLNLDELDNNFNFKYINRMSQKNKEHLFDIIKFNVPYNKKTI